jgi:hypothetical protein
VAGAVTVTSAMLLLVYGVVRLQDAGSGWGWTVGAFAGGLALLGGSARRSGCPR